MLRTPPVVAHEELGLAMGRLAVHCPEVFTAVSMGYTRALREHVAGRRADLVGDSAAFVRAVRGLIKLYADAGERPRRPRRKR